MLTKTEATIRQKQNTRKSYQNSRSNKQRICAQNDEKLRRLYRVKVIIVTQKVCAEERYEEIKKFAADPSCFAEWTGNYATQTNKYISESIVGEYSAYVKNIDISLDALCDEITRVENENYQLRGDILRLGSLINRLANEINKLFN